MDGRGEKNKKKRKEKKKKKERKKERRKKKKKKKKKCTADSNFVFGVRIYQSKATLTQLDPLPESLGFEIVSKTIGRGSYAAYGIPPPPSCHPANFLALRKANPIKGSLL